MTAKLVPFDSKLLAAMNACTRHAGDLIDSARLIQSAGKANIAFHLAILALEELGRRELLAVKSIERSGDWADKFFQDHIQKLFWCFFGGGFAKRRITAQALEEMKGLATRLHSMRLAGLYVDYAADGISIPSERVSTEEAERILSLAEAQYAMALEARPRKGRTKKDLEIQQWFLNTSEDPERRKFIFSGRSLDKLSELGNARSWVLWLKQEYERVDTEAHSLMEAEINRGRRLAEGEKGEQSTKWKIRIRLYSNSHSIRQKALNHWNERVSWIKLIGIPEKKDQLILEIQLGDQIAIQQLWLLAWGIARSFVTALNIATMGFWFWRIPTQVSKYYESIEDVVNKQQLTIERQPSLKPDWGANRVLTTQELDNVISTFVCMPGPGEVERHAPYGFYFGGLVFLSINDVHWQCETNILGNFLSSLRAQMQALGAISTENSFSQEMGAYLAEAFPELDEDRDRVLALCRAFEQEALVREQVTLKDATFSKLFCDAYFLHRVRPNELARRQAEQSAQEDA
jgi:AbiV family abortive infection protein